MQARGVFHRQKGVRMPRVIEPLKPGWVNSNLPDKFYKDTDYLKIIGFFVIHAFRPNRSSKGKTLKDYKWPKHVWKNTAEVGLKDVLLYSADLHLKNNTVDAVTRAPISDETIVSVQKLDEMNQACNRAGLQGNFTRTRDVNRIAVYNSEGNIMLSIFDHIRNSFAHGRFAIYGDGMIALESGKIVYDREKKKQMFEIRARMLLRKETLMQWISIIEAGSLEPVVVGQIEAIRIDAKGKRRKRHKG